MNKLSIGIIFGGASSEHEVSCASAASIINNIDMENFDVYKIWIDKNGSWYLYEGPTEYIENSTLGEGNLGTTLTPSILSPCSLTGGMLVLDKKESRFSVLKLDCILPIIHGTTGEDGVLQGLLKLSGIPFVGCRTASSAVCMDKALTKVVLDSQGIKQAEWLLFYKNEIVSNINAVIKKATNKFSYPMFIKPANTGSSIGVSKVYDQNELVAALHKATEYDIKVIVEEYIKGQEIELAVLEKVSDKGESEIIVSQCGEIKPGSDFYDYNDKYKNGVSVAIIPAQIDENISYVFKDTATKIFKILDCRGFCRCDFFLFGEQIIFNEVNTLPGFTKISMYPKLIAQFGIPYKNLITELILSAINMEKA